MTRIFASWGVALAALVCAAPSSGQGKAAEDPGKAAEDQLAAKDLHRSAAMYMARGEDEVKKASDAADLRLKEYRLAVSREKGAVRDLIALTKQRDELKQQIDQTMPTLRAQIQTLQQQQAALRRQASSGQGGRSRYGRMQGTQPQAEVNQLGVQINMLQAQGSQLTEMYKELDAQVKQLGAQPAAKSDDASRPAAKRTGASSDDRKAAYVKALGELRKHVDSTSETYAALADDAEVKVALETLSQRSARIKYVLGPSKRFLDTVKALEQAEARVASDTIIEEPKASASASPKKKLKAAKTR